MRLYPYLLLVLIVAAAPRLRGQEIPAPGQPRPFEDSAARITVLSEARSDRNRALLKMAVTCDAELRRITGRPPNRLKLYLVPDSDRHYVRQGLCFFGVQNLDNPMRVTHQLMRAVAWRLALELRGSSMSPEYVPSWLLAALHQHVIERQLGLTPRHLYVTCRTLAEADQLPPFATFVDDPIGPEFPVLYPLYSSASSCVLRILRRAEPDIVLRVLQTLSQGKPSEQLRRLLPEELGHAEADRWFHGRIEALIYRLDQPNSYARIREQLQGIERIAVMLPEDGGGYGVKRIRIDELPDYLEQYDYRRYDLSGMIADILYLLQDAPYVLRESLGQYVAALDALRRGRSATFVAELRKARANFEEAYAYGLRVSEHLESVEGTSMPAGKRLYQYVDRASGDLELTAYEQRVKAYLKELLERRGGEDDAEAETSAPEAEKGNAE